MDYFWDKVGEIVSDSGVFAAFPSNSDDSDTSHAFRTRGQGDPDIKAILETLLSTDLIVVDTHVHINSFDVREKNSEDAVRAAQSARGIDGIFQTEHNKAPDQVDDINVFSGIELHTKQGHVIVLGASEEQISSALEEYGRLVYSSGRLRVVSKKKKGTGKKDYFRRSQQKVVQAPRPRLELERVIDDFGNDPRVIFSLPHPLNRGGVFYRSRKVPRYMQDRSIRFFVEWVSAKGDPSHEDTKKLLRLVRKMPNFYLFAGSDTHGSGCLGFAGIAIPQAQSVNLRGRLTQDSYKCFHVHYRRSARDGIVSIANPTSTKTRQYAFKYIDRFGRKGWNLETSNGTKFVPKVDHT